MFNEPIYYTDDVIKAYADKRKPLNEYDVTDLLRCLTGFIQKEHDKNNLAAVHLPCLGHLYKTPQKKEITRNAQPTDFERRWIEEIYNKKPRQRFKRYYENWTKEDLQYFQNNIEQI